jgi:hypothetical protein
MGDFCLTKPRSPVLIFGLIASEVSIIQEFLPSIHTRLPGTNLHSMSESAIMHLLRAPAEVEQLNHSAMKDVDSPFLGALY